MKTLHCTRATAAPERRGAALLLSFLVLLVIIAVVFQINNLTNTDARVARNDVTLTKMDHAIESAFLQVAEMLVSDAGDSGGGDASGVTDALGGGDAAAGEDGGGGGSVDSRMDEWGQPQSTNINDLSMRILVQDEDSKYNILSMLVEDPDEAQLAFDRVLRILDACREGTEDDLDSAQADAMARAMRRHMLERSTSSLSRPSLTTFNEENTELGIPITMREFLSLEEFEPRHFRDYFDIDGARVHAITSFLTIYTAPSIGPVGDVAEGGNGVNVNTAPLAVLAGLMDSRDVRPRAWEGVRDYRNEAEEPAEDGDEPEPMYDEFGEEIVQTRVFDDLEELDEVYDFEGMEPDVKDDLLALLKVDSQVFSVYITARVPTLNEEVSVTDFNSRREQEEFERSGSHIVRTVRAVMWRQAGDEETVIIPLVRWEVLDYAPLVVLDFEDNY